MIDLHIAVWMDIRLVDSAGIKAWSNGPNCAVCGLNDCLEITYLYKGGIEQGVA